VDTGLAKLAKAQGVTILNLHEVADSMKPSFVVGDKVNLTVVKPGKENGQGIGYLDDGTMVVVEDGQEFVGSERRVAVVSVLQTPTGKLVFAKDGGET
jgi:uncharacterized protein YacL